MRRIDDNSKQKAKKLTLLLASLVLAAARSSAQNTTATEAQPEPKRLIIISIPDRKLALVEDGEVVKVYPVAVGRRVSPSPSGSFEIINRVTNPTYYHKGQIVPPGPDNPVGTRWIGLNQPHYGIHGTNQPRSIGKAASHGCIRMAQADLEELFEVVRVGDEVQIRTEADMQTAQIFGSKVSPAQQAVVAQAGVATAAGGLQ